MDSRHHQRIVFDQMKRNPGQKLTHGSSSLRETCAGQPPGLPDKSIVCLGGSARPRSQYLLDTVRLPNIKAYNLLRPADLYPDQI